MRIFFLSNFAVVHTFLGIIRESIQKGKAEKYAKEHTHKYVPTEEKINNKRRKLEGMKASQEAKIEADRISKEIRIEERKQLDLLPQTQSDLKCGTINSKKYYFVRKKEISNEEANKIRQENAKRYLTGETYKNLYVSEYTLDQIKTEQERIARINEILGDIPE